MNELDSELARQGVFFLPWIGERYEQGFKGKRLLVLGESHYQYESLEENRRVEDPLDDPQLTRACVAGVIMREDWVGNFWKFVEQALLNVERCEMAVTGEALWQSIAFYNFVQSSAGMGPRERPSEEAFDASRAPFRAVIDALRPERVLVCGKGMWERMEEAPSELYLHDDLQGYYLANRKPVWCLATVHPTSGRYSWSRLHPIITAFLKEPHEARSLLR